MDFFDRHKPLAIFIACSLFCLISLAVQGSGFTLTFEGILSALFSPFQKGYHAIHGSTGRFTVTSSDVDRLKDELAKTREKLQKYESSEMDISEIKKENERLRSILSMKQMLTYDTISASIIAKDPDNWFRTLIINRGANDGIKVNMPVIAYQGGIKAVVGKIIEVRKSVSRIQPLIAPDIKIGVKLGEAGFPGLLSGYTYNSNLCVINYITRAAPIKFGDKILTSGQAGALPQGLFIGTVVQTDLPETSPYQTAIIKPFIDYNLLEDVFIIKKDPDSELFEIFEEFK